MASTVTRAGTPVHLAGNFPRKGQAAPAFTLVGKDLADVSLASVRKFNQHASQVATTVVLCISADLPFAQNRFCGAEGLENVVTLSTLRGREFLENYGVLIADSGMAGLAARAVVVLDENNTVLHSELVPEIKSEPNYDAALAALG